MNDRMFKHTQAHKLEDPARLTWLPPSDVVARLRLSEGLRVLDVGAGTGYFSLPIARAVGERGHVFAVDLQQEMLDMLRSKLQREDAPKNISLHQGEASHLPLPDNSVDLVLLANIWHELDDQPAVLKEALRILSADGRLAILDWRPEMASPPGPPQHHRIAADRVADTLTSHGFEPISSVTVGQFSYLVIANRT